MFVQIKVRTIAGNTATLTVAETDTINKVISEWGWLLGDGVLDDCPHVARISLGGTTLDSCQKISDCGITHTHVLSVDVMR